MPAVEPVVIVLVASSLAAAVAALGALPYWRRRQPGRRQVGSAYALAAGLMLGAGYLLAAGGLGGSWTMALVGALAGVGYTRWVQAYALVDELDPDPERAAEPEYALRTLLQSGLHSGAEGVAIGVAMVADLEFGVFMGLVLAVHNLAEGMALTDILRRRDASLLRAAGLCVVAKVPQPLVALAVWALSPVLRQLLPAAQGFAAGALLFLVLTELLPAAYPRAGRTLGAALTSAAAGTVVLAEALLH